MLSAGAFLSVGSFHKIAAKGFLKIAGVNQAQSSFFKNNWKQKELEKLYLIAICDLISSVFSANH
jgi:hypothetical protein